MGFLGRALGIASGMSAARIRGGDTSPSPSPSLADVATGAEDGYCPSCDAELDDPSDYSEDLGCPACYSGARYCCGGIYEMGEDTCASCGDPL